MTNTTMTLRLKSQEGYQKLYRSNSRRKSEKSTAACISNQNEKAFEDSNREHSDQMEQRQHHPYQRQDFHQEGIPSR